MARAPLPLTAFSPLRGAVPVGARCTATNDCDQPNILQTSWSAQTASLLPGSTRASTPPRPSSGTRPISPAHIGDTTEPPTIRKALAKEAESISSLALRSKAHWGYSPAFMEACREELTVTAADIEAAAGSDAARYVVAERDDDSMLLGYYAIEKQSDNELYELEALFVEPEFIGRGIGRALMIHAQETVVSLGGRRMLIQADPHAERFYRAAGGRCIGERESDSLPGRILPLFEIDLGG